MSQYVACSLCGYEQNVKWMTDGRCTDCEKPYQAGLRTAYAACAAEARRRAEQHASKQTWERHRVAFTTDDMKQMRIEEARDIATWADRAGGE